VTSSWTEDVIQKMIEVVVPPVGVVIAALRGDPEPATPPGFSPQLTDLVGAGLPTELETSGAAAAAISQLHEEQQRWRDQSSDAAEKISEVLLSARPVTPDGQQKLNAIQQRIIDAVNDPGMNIDTPAGVKAYLQFLRGQLGDIRELITSGSLSDQDAARALAALTGLIPPEPGQELGQEPAPDSADTPGSEPGTTEADPGVDAGTDLGLGPEPPMPDPLDPALTSGLTDPGLMSGLSGLGSAIPGMMSPLGGLGIRLVFPRWTGTPRG